MSFKFEKEFREAYPETVGETDSEFDTSNYADFLEDRLLKLEEGNSSTSNNTKRDEICSNSICDYCCNEDKCIICEEWCYFKGRKLSPVS
jgi:hypothetical protein